MCKHKKIFLYLNIKINNPRILFLFRFVYYEYYFVGDRK